MTYLILSDIHGNVQALDAVVAAAAPSPSDRVLVLGDLVGYGAAPNAVIERVLALEPLAVIRGNHDKAACRLADASDFNHVARAAAMWTAATLTAENRMYLERLPQGPRSIDDILEICHGAPFDEDYYIFDAGDASQALDTSAAALTFFGHTHVQIAFREMTDGGRRVVTPLDAETIDAGGSARTLVNPGSVGQPRDGDPRAAYAMFDTDTRTVHLHRVAYDIAEAQRRIREAGLHPNLAERLSVGR